MTTNQLIAMAFPLITAAVVALTGASIVRWVERERVRIRQRTAVRESVIITETRRFEAINHCLEMALRLINQAQRDLEKLR